MATSQEYMQQLEQMGEMPNYRDVIANAYESPVLKPLVGEAQNLESQYLPNIFDTFANMGTGAGDMSAAAKMQMIGRNLGNLGSRIGANRDIQNFYNSQIQDLANTQAQMFGMKQQKFKDLYQMAFQNEEAQRQEQARRAAAGAQAASLQAMKDLYNRQAQAAGMGDPSISVGPVQSKQIDRPDLRFSGQVAEQIDNAWRNSDNSLALLPRSPKDALNKFLSVPASLAALPGYLTGWY